MVVASAATGGMPKPMNGGFAVTREAEAAEVRPRRGQRHERIELRSPGNTGPRRRILRMRTSSKSRSRAALRSSEVSNGKEDRGRRKAALATAGGNPLKTQEAQGRHRHETRPERLGAE
jgi:hypothetical protein